MEKRGTALKGFFFTLLVVVLFSLILLSMRAWMRGQQAPEELNAVRERADMMTGMMSSCVADADRMTYLAGNRSLYYAAFYSAYNLTAHNSSNHSVYEIMWNASLNGSSNYSVPTSTCNASSTLCYFANQTENANMSLWWQRFADAAQKYGFSADWRLLSFDASQSSLSGVSIAHTTSFELDDSAGVASFNRTASFNRSVNITGFEDPGHSIFTAGATHRNITWWPYPVGYDFVTTIATASNGSGWVYGNATTFPDCCNDSSTNCTYLGSVAVDQNTTLVVNDSSILAATCPSVANAFRGILSNHGNSSMSSITVPNAFNFGSYNITQLVPNGSAVLINNDSGHEVLNVTGLRNLTEHARHYRENQNGPDFMMRLENNFSASQYGIESLMNYSEVLASNSNRSWADYYFLNGTDCSAITCYKIKGTLNCENSTTCTDPSGTLPHFRLDNGTALITPLTGCAPPPSGLVGWWPGDGNASDISGYGNNATLTGAGYDTGRVWQAFNFSATSSYASLSGIAVNTSAGAKNTVEFWMYWRGTEGKMPFGWYQYDLQFSYGCLGFNTAQNDSLGVSSTGLANGWHHVAAIFYNGVPDATNSELWIDGVNQTIVNCNITYSPVSASANSTAQISGWVFTPQDPYYYLNGEVDELAIYNRALTGDEIQSIYNAGAAGKCRSQEVPHLDYYGMEDLTIPN